MSSGRSRSGGQAHRQHRDAVVQVGRERPPSAAAPSVGGGRGDQPQRGAVGSAHAARSARARRAAPAARAGRAASTRSMNNVPPRRPGVASAAASKCAPDSGQERTAAARGVHGAGDGALADPRLADQMQRQVGGERLRRSRAPRRRSRRAAAGGRRARRRRRRAPASASSSATRRRSSRGEKRPGSTARASRLAAPRRASRRSTAPVRRREEARLAAPSAARAAMIRFGSGPANARGGVVVDPAGLHLVVARQEDADRLTDCW